MDSELTLSLSIDIGGTFTDFTLHDTATGELKVHKALTSPDDPSRALIQGLREMLEEVGVSPEQLRLVVHSTTLATNSIIERKGAKTALLTTKGFRDILEFGRERIYDMHDLHARFPDPIVPRHRRVEVSERIDRDGVTLSPLDLDEAAAAVEDLVEQGVESIAISLLHAYRNPDHERALKGVIESGHPDLSVSLSSEAAPVINEYERTSTVAADAYIKPAVSRYIQGVERDLGELGYGGQLLVMHSAGGVLSADAASERPIRLLESGPAAGALAAGFYSEMLGEPDLISLDMGGTTAKTCVIEGGQPSQSNGIEVARVHRFKSGSGLPILIPVLDLIEIGSGGGSIAHLDNLGLLRVGPQSAGASPGPACYALGGTQPTVTDANLLLGYLNPGYFLGGRMTLDAQAAESALDTLGSEMGMDAVGAAWGVYSVVTENMAAAARIHIIGRNKDPRNYSIVAFGGAGPAHACEVARILGATDVVVPLGAGVTAALGCLAAPLSFENVRSMPGLLEQSDWEAVNRAFAEMESLGREMLTNAGVSDSDVTLTASADMRLVGQIHEINVPVPVGPLSGSDVEGISADFHEIYQELYSRRNLSLPIEVQNWRLLVSGPQPSLELQQQETSDATGVNAALKGTRRAYFANAHGPNQGGFVDCPIYDRYTLPVGATLEGPAIVEEAEATTIIRPGDSASVDSWLNLRIRVSGG
jgi:N-methylhydantoinase A/oxoprolinase/acetone carboxylase beta subunit